MQHKRIKYPLQVFIGVTFGGMLEREVKRNKKGIEKVYFDFLNEKSLIHVQNRFSLSFWSSGNNDHKMNDAVGSGERIKKKKTVISRR